MWPPRTTEVACGITAARNRDDESVPVLQGAQCNGPFDDATPPLDYYSCGRTQSGGYFERGMWCCSDLDLSAELDPTSKWTAVVGAVRLHLQVCTLAAANSGLRLSRRRQIMLPWRWSASSAVSTILPGQVSLSVGQ